MPKPFLKTACFSVTAALVGATAHELLAWGMGQKCTNNVDVSCPASGICQPPGHCGIVANHKCTNGAASFPTCVPWTPTSNCGRSPTGCQFEDYTPVCGAPLTVFTSPQCYGECL